MNVAASLFLITALVSGWQVFWSIMWGVWGKPTHPLECAALLGSLILLFGAIQTFLGNPRGGLVAAGGCLLLWLLYAPAIWHTVTDVPPGRRFNLLGFVPPVLLLLSSLLCPLVVRYGANEYLPSELQPDSAPETNSEDLAGSDNEG